jgi:hypothetical protein
MAFLAVVVDVFDAAVGALVPVVIDDDSSTTGGAAGCGLEGWCQAPVCANVC